MLSGSYMGQSQQHQADGMREVLEHLIDRGIMSCDISRKMQTLNKMKNERAVRLDRPYNVKRLAQGKWRFPILVKLMRIKRFFYGGKIRVLHPYHKLQTPVIFAITHIGRFDIEIAYDFLNEHSILLSGSSPEFHGSIEGAMLESICINYVDRIDPLDRRVAKQQMIRDIQNGANIMWFPEGTWNMSPNLLILPLRWGIIEVAKQTGAPIIPIALDQREKLFTINAGQPFYTLPDEKLEVAISRLRDDLATLKWEIYESFPIESRRMIADDYWQIFIRERGEEWKYIDFEFDQRYIWHTAPN